MRKQTVSKKTRSALLPKAVSKTEAKAERKPMPKAKSRPAKLELPDELCLRIHDLMVQSRVLEERLIKVYRTGDAFFWIGGPGEEAFGVTLGLLAKKGQGPEFDYMHLHYRATPTLMAFGMTMEDSLRLQMNRATDPSTGGRNFCNHYCFPQWNVVPVSSPIEVQYPMAVGTAIAQKRRKNGGISIVTGGDAGTAEGDFASCLVWASRPANPLPMLITVQNNKIGISTDYESQHGEKNIADRGKAFGMRTEVVNGNDPIACYLAIKEQMEYVRKYKKPLLAEFRVSRLYGHSSADGANRQTGDCCIELFEKRLIEQKLITAADCQALRTKYDEESRQVAEKVRSEPVPQADTIWDHVYAGNENGDWRKF